MITHDMKLGRTALRLISSGSQTAEGRLASGRLRAIKIGDILNFNAGALLCRVTRITIYSSFAEMVHAETPTALGEPDDEEQAVRNYRKYFHWPDAEKRGVIAFGIEGISPKVATLWD